MPAVIVYDINTAADTPAVVDPITLALTPKDANGDYSLRSVVEFANANPLTGNQSLNRYDANLSQVAGQTITLDPNLGTLVLESNIGFLGNGVTVERSTAPNVANFRLFQVGVHGGAAVKVRFNDMTLQGGHTVFGDDNGGAILVERRAQDNNVLQVESCLLTNNYATGRRGAIAAPGVSGAGPEIYISDSTLSLNTAEVAGGAIDVEGAGYLEIDYSSISQNQATGDVAADRGFGGGLFISTTITLIQSTDISDNGATNDGGGLYFSDANSLGSLTMNGGMFYDNTSWGGKGGGFYIDAPGDTINFSQVAVEENSAGRKGGGGYVNNGTLDGSLAQLWANQDANGVNGVTAGIAFKQANGASAPISVPPNEQTIVAD